MAKEIKPNVTMGQSAQYDKSGKLIARNVTTEGTERTNDSSCCAVNTDLRCKCDGLKNG